MLFGPQRGSFFTVFDRFAETFGLPIAVVAIALIFGNMQALLENSFILAVTLIAPARRLFSYFFTYYSVDEEKFHVRSGLLNKKNLEIPLDSINLGGFYTEHNIPVGGRLRRKSGQRQQLRRKRHGKGISGPKKAGGGKTEGNTSFQKPRRKEIRGKEGRSRKGSRR